MAHINKKTIKRLKKKLLQKRLEIIKHLLPKELNIEIGDELDQAQQTLDKELLYGLAANEKIIFDSIESALKKIEKGNYGFCEACNEKISIKRLSAIPWARYCLKCQQKIDISD